ncbi:MAG: class I SAM-dependent methyltransferase [Synergistaceae bacterium]|nr:class I SAM-dependent methyltransferase [Synergistaceae bacterium]
MVDESLSSAIKGNPHEYFTQYKIYHLRKIFASHKCDKTLKILDYGCGTGSLSCAMFNAFPYVIIHGFDVSGESIKKIPSEIMTGDNFFTSELERLDSDYDIALLVTVLHHVIPVSERADVIHNIYSRLKPGGKIIIIEHNMKNPLTRKVVLNSEVDADAIMLAPDECINLLKEANFKDISNRYIEFFPKQLESLRFLDDYFSRLPLGSQFMTIGTKIK